MNVERHWLTLTVNMITEEMWQRWISSYNLAVRSWQLPITVHYQTTKLKGLYCQSWPTPQQVPRSVVTNTLTVHSLWARLQSQLISSSHCWCRLCIKKHATMSQRLTPSAGNSTHRALSHQMICPCMRPSHWVKHLGYWLWLDKSSGIWRDMQGC